MKRTLGGLLFVKVVEMLFVLIAIILVALADGVCSYYPFRDTSVCEFGGDKDMSLNRNWGGDYRVRYGDSKVQYFVFVSSIVLILATVVGLVAFLCGFYKAKQTGIAISIFGMCLCITNGALEAWFTVGFGTDKYGAYGGFVRSWAAATALYFLASICYVADLMLTKHWYRNFPTSD